MRVLLTAASKFHAFHLASQLDRRGHLGLFLTTYYSGRRTWLNRWIGRQDQEAIAPERVRVFPWVEVARVLDRMPAPMKRILGVDYTNYWYHARHILFDLWTSRFVDRSFDLVVAWGEHALFTLRRARRLGIPAVLYTGTAHNAHRWKLLEEEYARWKLPYRLPPQILKRSIGEYAEADRISVVSGYARRSFEENGVASARLIHITPGVDLDRFRPGVKTDSTFRAVFVGLVDARKGLPYLLEAWKPLARAGAELWVVGTVYPEMKAILEAYEGLFVHKGTVPQAQLPDLMAQADVFVLPTLDEGFAAVLLQAMACGLPVLATTNSGGEDVVREGENGFIVPIRDADALQEKLSWFSSHPEKRREMARCAVETARECTWDRYGDRVERQYSLLVAR